MKLEKVRKLKVGDIIVGAEQASDNHLPEGSLWKVIEVEPSTYDGFLHVRCKKLQGQMDVTRWPFPQEIAKRLPRVGEKVKVVKSDYCSIRAGDVKKVLKVDISESGVPLIVLGGGFTVELTLSFRHDAVERVKKVKASNETK